MRELALEKVETFSIFNPLKDQPAYNIVTSNTTNSKCPGSQSFLLYHILSKSCGISVRLLNLFSAALFGTKHSFRHATLPHQTPGNHLLVTRGEYNAFSGQNICPLKLGFWAFLAHFVTKFSTFCES